MFRSINPYEELIRERSKDSIAEELLTEAEQILQGEENTELDIIQRLRSTPRGSENSVRQVHAGEIFTRSQIRKIAINYRLRFLDSSQYKGEFPYEAIRKIKDLEKAHGIRLDGFKMIAPVRMFSLKDPNADPLLFASAGKDKYLFIHRWGSDLAWYRKWLALPFKNFNTYLIWLVSLSVIINLCLPTDLIAASEKHKAQEYSIRGFLLIHFFLLLVGMSFFFFFSKGRGLSELEWNDKFKR